MVSVMDALPPEGDEAEANELVRPGTPSGSPPTVSTASTSRFSTLTTRRRTALATPARCRPTASSSSARCGSTWLSSALTPVAPRPDNTPRSWSTAITVGTLPTRRACCSCQRWCTPTSVARRKLTCTRSWARSWGRPPGHASRPRSSLATLQRTTSRSSPSGTTSTLHGRYSATDGTIQAVARAEWIYARGGPDGLNWVFGFLTEAFNGDRESLSRRPRNSRELSASTSGTATHTSRNEVAKIMGSSGRIAWLLRARRSLRPH